MSEPIEVPPGRFDLTDEEIANLPILDPKTLEVPDNVRAEIERLQRRGEANFDYIEQLKRERKALRRELNQAEQRAERAEAEFNRLDLEVVSQRQARERAEAALREMLEAEYPAERARAKAKASAIVEGK